MSRVHLWVPHLLFAALVSACVDESSSEKPDSTAPSIPEATTYTLSAEVLELAKRSGCLACHSVDKKIVGPAWREVALKYQGDASALGTLIVKVKTGGKGVWGDLPMPPYSPRISDTDIALLVASILQRDLDSGTMPPSSISVSVAAGAVVEHNVFLVEGNVYSFAANASSGDVDVAIYSVDSSGARVLVDASQTRGVSEQLTLRAAATGTFIVAVTGYVESQYTLSVSAFDKDQFLELAKVGGCLACHSIEKKVVGPAFGDVAAKYRDDSGAKALLMSKVASGGKGVWGEVPMPPYSPRVAEDDIERLVAFVLSLPDVTSAPPQPVPPPPPPPPPPAAPPPPPVTNRDQMLELAKNSGCLACHSIEKKVVGPAWIDVAYRYRNDTGAYAALFAKTAVGGTGEWGSVPMPPYWPRVSETSIAQLIVDILALDAPTPLPPGVAWTVAGAVAQGETDLMSFVGDSWTLYTIELESLTGDADLTVYAVPADTGTRRLIGKSDLKTPLDRVWFQTEALPETHDVEVLGYLSSNYGLSVLAQPLTLPDPPLPTADQFSNYVYVLSDATRILAKSNGCLACHAETARVVGPSFKAISLRYKDTAGSKDQLIAKVKAGGKGYWGEVPMPPYSPRVSDADIDALVQSIVFGDPATPPP